MDQLKQRQIAKLWGLGLDTVEIADIVELSEADVCRWLAGWRTVIPAAHRVSA